MDSLADWRCPAKWILAGLLLWGTFRTGDTAQAQTPGSGQGRPSAQGPGQKPNAGAAAQAAPNAKHRGAAPKPEKAQAPEPAKTQQSRREFSEAYRDSLRKTLEQRRQRRARLARIQGLDDTSRPIGAIVPWPMPPALIIRHTADVHGEVDSLLDRLRR
jgi:hypothetical protein